MKSLSDEAQRLLAKLGDDTSWVENIKRLFLKRHSVLLEMAKLGEPALIVYIVPFIGHPQLGPTAVRVIDELAAGLTSRELMQLSFNGPAHIAFGTPWSWTRLRSPHKSWYELEAGDVTLFDDGSSGTVWALGLTANHGNGFVRQAALERLGRRRTGRELPFLLLRANDWVTQVRRLVLGLLEERLDPDYVEHFARNFFLVERLLECGRANHRPLVEAVSKLVFHPDHRGVLLDVVGDCDRWTARALLRCLVEHVPIDDHKLIAVFLGHSDLVTRTMAARWLVANASCDSLATYLGRLKADSASSIRKVFLYAVVDRFPEEIESSLQALLLDRSAAVRDAARFYLRESEEIDSERTYRDALGSESSRVLAIAIDGLVETKQADCLETIREHQTSEFVAVRKAVLRAIAAFGASDEIDVFLKALCSEEPGISRTGRTCMAKRTRVSHQPMFETILRETTWSHVERNVICLFGSFPRWQRLVALLMVCEKFECQRELVEDLIVAWNRDSLISFVRPNETVLRDIQQRLEACGHTLPGNLSRGLSRTVEIWSP